MSTSRRTLLRGAVTLGLVGAFAAAMVVVPAGAHVTRRLSHLYKHLDKRYVNEGDKAADSNKLDGLDSSAFQQEADLLFAVVNNAGDATVQIVRGRGATSVIPFIASIVTFNRPVDTCAWTATAEGNRYAHAVLNANDQIAVFLRDAGGAFVTGVGERFHLVVVC